MVPETSLAGARLPAAAPPSDGAYVQGQGANKDFILLSGWERNSGSSGPACSPAAAGRRGWRR